LPAQRGLFFARIFTAPGSNPFFSGKKNPNHSGWDKVFLTGNEVRYIREFLTCAEYPTAR
jgi:hypothetical protein